MEGWRLNFLLVSAFVARRSVIISTLVVVLLGLMSPVFAADEDSNNSEKGFLSEPLVQPNVTRRKIKKVAIDTENLEMGFFYGIYATEDFGNNPVTGGRLAYHITEDIFFEAFVGATDTSKTSAEELALFDIVAADERELTYYDINIGYNILPGEVFIGENWAFNFAFYLSGGIGSTNFNGERRATVVTGAGMRFLATDWMAIHVDVRDHVFKQNILTIEKTAHNIEAIASMTFYF